MTVAQLIELLSTYQQDLEITLGPKKGNLCVSTLNYDDGRVKLRVWSQEEVERKSDAWAEQILAAGLSV